jgi:hypothetical protein
VQAVFVLLAPASQVSPTLTVPFPQAGAGGLTVRKMHDVSQYVQADPFGTQALFVLFEPASQTSEPLTVPSPQLAPVTV